MDKLKPAHVAVIEEGQGASDCIWEAVERLCADPRGKGKIFSVLAPTDALLAASEPAGRRGRSAGYGGSADPFIRAASLADDLDG